MEEEEEPKEGEEAKPEVVPLHPYCGQFCFRSFLIWLLNLGCLISTGSEEEEDHNREILGLGASQ